MKLIVGLGNPGKKYEKTRHNIGFLVLDRFVQEHPEFNFSAWEQSKKFNAAICGGLYKGEKVLLVKPLTFMNNSGQAVGMIAQYYKVRPNDLIVVHDEKDIQLGEIRVQKDRGAAGHNGVKSIIEHCGTKDFTRIRVGIAPENPKKMRDAGKFVLGKFGLFERSTVDEVIQHSIQHIVTCLNVKPTTSNT